MCYNLNMNSENKTEVQQKARRSFIEEARRTQIINATVDVIAEVGSVQASLAKIAERAGISTSLILYHFKDRDELMAAVLASIISEWETPAREAMARHTTASAKLKSYIEARLAYIGTRPKQCIAMINLLFTVPAKDNAQTYRTQEEGFEIDDVVALLEEGQKNGEFLEFNTGHMAMMIRSTIDQFLGYSQDPGINLEQYIQDLLEWYGILISKKGRL